MLITVDLDKQMARIIKAAKEALKKKRLSISERMEKGRGVTKSRVCLVCGALYRAGRMYTCSEVCHEKMVDALVEEFGESKRIVDADTGVAYKVPIREVSERGLWLDSLKKYPKMEGKW